MFVTSGVSQLNSVHMIENQQGQRMVLMENDGNGEFTDITASAGLVSGLQGLYGLQVAFRDFDNDGFLDIIVASTFDTPERFFLNDGDSTFTLVDSLFHSSDDMHSFAIGDLNSDGFLDV